MSTAKDVAIYIVIAINLAGLIYSLYVMRKLDELRLRAIERELTKKSVSPPAATGSHQPTIQAVVPGRDQSSTGGGAAWGTSAPEGRDER